MKEKAAPWYCPKPKLPWTWKNWRNEIYLRFFSPETLMSMVGPRIQTGMLGRAVRNNMMWEWPDGSTLVVDQDYYGDSRHCRPFPGSFQNPGSGEVVLRVAKLK